MSMVFESQPEASEDFVDFDEAPESSANGSEFDDFEEDEYDDTPIFGSNGAVDDFVGDNSVIFDVEGLVAEFEAESGRRASPAARLRKRLEALAERKRRHAELMDFDDYELD
ncbi:MAG: hypothetical protein V2J12_05165 [Gammaproteobacteria bacterium]|jgi:hypothetical protein|nr:hypothetical protein [Gammaproteobacteria bacterium]